MPKRLLNSQDVASILGVNPSALSNWRARQRNDRLPPADFITGYAKGGQHLWWPETISRFIEEGRAEMDATLSQLCEEENAA